MTLHTAVETISVNPPDEELVALAASLSPGRLRSAAGRIALRRAVLSLVERLDCGPLPPEAVHVTNAEDGHPVVFVDEAAFPRAAALCRKMRVSISHSRRTALGAVAMEEALL